MQVKTGQNQIITIALAGAGVMPGLAKDQADKAGSSSRSEGLSNPEEEKGGISRPSIS